ncbi:DUF5071 domain-containing protein [uncultured Roseibium sp.]|uniref:DUF5071 domain-containing protein n=1 Tax=uncultured Roseibium sp. TaxID=1936171 RepID=UPI00261E1B2E|nr:DUF5071 domain-containing protein [uncultured Roseibium sp.]
MTDILLEQIAGLDWNEPKEVQIAAKEYVRLNIGDDLSPLMLRNLEKSQWGNAAEVLKDVECSKLAQFTPDLLCWLKDMNWPGASEVLAILQKFQKQELMYALGVAISKARDDSDEDWLEMLFLLREQLTD